MPALPVLGAAAKFLMSNGARAATMKFGKAAVDKAKDQIKKRDSAIADKAGKANIGVKRTQKPESTRRMQDTKRDKKMAKEETARRSGKSDLLRPPKDEAPLRFRRGGMNTGRKIKDEPVKTKTNRGARPERKKARRPAEKMGPPMPTPTGPETPKSDLPKVNMTPTSPTVDASVTPKVTSTPVTKRPQVTGKGGRDVVGKGPMGDRKLANVTREQLVAAGLTTGPKGLRTYLNKFDELGRRPKPSDFKKKEPKKVKRTGSARPMSERKFMAGGMKSKMGTKGGAMGGKKKMAPGMMGGGMKSKMSTKGGAMGGKKKMAPGMMAGGLKPAPEGNKGKGLKKLPKKVRNQMGYMQAGGMKKSKGYAAGGKKSKGYAAGGKKSKMATKKKVSKAKVRGAGIARKGVRPVKFR